MEKTGQQIMKIIRNTELIYFHSKYKKTENAGHEGGWLYTSGKINSRVLISLASPYRLTLDT